MKKAIRFLAVSLACFLLIGAVAFAVGNSYTKEILASYVGVQLVVDGNLIVPKDADGNIVEPFIYEGTTYLPVRAVGEALGKSVSWDGSTKTVYVGNVPGEDIYLLDVCPPYETGYYSGWYSSPDYFFMMGQKYYHGFELIKLHSYAYFNLNGEYSTLEFDFGHIDDTTMSSATFHIYLDGKYIQTIEGTPEMMVEHISIPLNYALQLRIVSDSTSHAGDAAYYGFANAVLH